MYTSFATVITALSIPFHPLSKAHSAKFKHSLFSVITALKVGSTSIICEPPPISVLGSLKSRGTRLHV